MPPRSPQYEESFFTHISKGFFFAVGFTPAFLLMCFVITFIFFRGAVGGIDQVSNDVSFQKQAAHIIEQSPPIQQLRQVTQQSAPVAEIGPSRPLSVKEQQEKACNLAILQFSQTNSDVDKKRVYQLCPDDK